MKKNKGVKFTIVGVGNTVLDFGLMNIFSLFLPMPIPNFLSTGLSMLSSFYFNKKWTFDSHHKSRKTLTREIILFFVFTMIGLWVIQTPLMYLLTSITPPGLRHLLTVHLGVYWTTFFINNFAKAIASIVSLTWNFLTYKHFVFRDDKIIKESDDDGDDDLKK
ncbi:MAG: GtrA family protein [Candidatus Nanoperiomorbaceae bacterium]